MKLILHIFLAIAFLSSKICFSKQSNISNIQIDVKLAAVSLSQYIYKMHDPCDDFYSFSCENWILKKHLEKMFKTNFNSNTDDLQSFDTFAEEVLTKRKYDNTSKVIKKLNDMRDKCQTLEVELQQVCTESVVSFGYYAYASLYMNQLENNKRIKKSFEIVKKIFNAILNEFKLLIEEKKDFLDKSTMKNYLKKVNKIKFNRKFHKALGNISTMEKCYSFFNFSINNSAERMLKDIDNYKSNISNDDKKLKETCINYIINKKVENYGFSRLITRNAYYHLSLKNIVITPLILNYPCFHPQFPMSLNYGCIGTIIGHEIVHAFDFFGINFDDEGNINQNITNKDSKNKYREKSNCLSLQYTNETLKSIGSSTKKFQILNENIADNGGIKIAHRSYIKYLQSIGGKEPKIPGYEKFTEEQLFFINFARFFCSMKHYSKNIKIIKDGPHFPGNIRVLNTLSNYQPFSKAYGCKAGSGMNPKDKCELWL